MNVCSQRGAAALLLPLVLTACTGASIYAPMPQSGFTAPNMTVAPLQHVKGTAARTYVLGLQTPAIPDARLQREAVMKALQGSEGDLIINADYQVVLTSFAPLPIMRVEGTVEGTAARVVQIGARPLQ
ncbi:hypothetical protein E2C06_02375 [Dankookia rubra]|uniref:Lipoprotein n=1 Tax=Dankookia rubra TaxID=1442381 RepID=A0A4R5QN56_9PROT|nr:hypothetical protein [Dankookia rubra]TDH64211.1 hypothetical protein E2C06_02375 [Dankookia rubra]